MVNKICLDTSIIIDGKITQLIREGKMKDAEIIVPAPVLDELQAQASKGRQIGFIGLEEIKRIRAVADEKKLKLRFTGARPSLDDIKLAKSGRMDAIIRDVAKTEGATLYTADYVQALVAEAEGVMVVHIAAEIKTTGLTFEKFFTPETLSVHLKEDTVPMAKIGLPGNFQLIKLRDEPLDKEELNNIATEVAEATRISDEGFVEINSTGALVFQLGNYRIAITRPPFSDGLEVTIVRPIVKMKLEDYKLSEKLMDRLEKSTEGVVIAGPPGSGKSTLAASMAEFYMKKSKIVKTLESPRDLQVGPEITQYGPLEGDFEKTADILLLVRPDFTVFDEVRRTKDFNVFSDLRLAGIGMIGVVHASDAIDAIQRFMGRMELGMIPHVLDTVIFVSAGQVKKVLDLSLTVKVPSGMTEADLARPIVEVRDFETNSLEYEIYTFGEENIIVPVNTAKEATSAVNKLAADRILMDIRKFDPHAVIEVTSPNAAIVRVENEVIPRLIGKSGVMITEIEKRLGIHIDVQPRIPTLGREVDFGISESGNSLEMAFDKRLTGKVANVYVDDAFLFSATIGKKGVIKVSKTSDIGGKMLNTFIKKGDIKVLI